MMLHFNIATAARSSKLPNLAFFVLLLASASVSQEENDKPNGMMASCVTEPVNPQQVNFALQFYQPSKNSAVLLAGKVFGDRVVPGASVQLKLLPSSAAFCGSTPSMPLPLTPSTPENNQVTFSGSMPRHLSLAGENDRRLVDRLIAAVVKSGQNTGVFCCNVEKEKRH